MNMINTDLVKELWRKYFPDNEMSAMSYNGGDVVFLVNPNKNYISDRIPFSFESGIYKRNQRTQTRKKI